MKNLWIAAGFCFAASPLFSQGLPPLTQSPESDPIGWDGYYIGLAVTSGDVSGPAGTTDSGTQGVGLHFGYLRDTGVLVVGGEFAYVAADFDDLSSLDLDSARLKAIGGVDAGLFLPYAFVGLSNVEASVGDASISEMALNYGLGGRVALGAEGRVVAGLEYLVEEVDDFGGSGLDFDNNDVSLRLDYRY
jgi:outer membrane immunogenic protein